MKPATVYTGSFLNTQVDYSDNSANQQTILITISDVENLIPDDQLQLNLELDLADLPLTSSVVNNDEDKFTPIRSKQLEIVIFSGHGIDISTFASGGDNRWKVEAAINDTAKIFFTGFLSISDLEQEFQPEPNKIVLTATDGLGALHDIPLTDFNGDTPRDDQRLADFLTWALSKTGLSLELWVINNIRFVDYPNDHFYERGGLLSKTFEADIAECEDCWNVIEKILGESCYLTQWKGRWYIQNVDELQTGNVLMASFDTDGTFIEFKAPIADKHKYLGVGLDLSWFGIPDSPPNVSLERPYREVKEIYRYELPQEIVDNIDFSRGDWLSPINAGPEALAYNLDDWTTGRYVSDSEVGTSSALVTYIYRKFEDGYEKQRYLVVKSSIENNPSAYVRSNGIYVGEKDKGTISVDFKPTRRHTANNINTFAVMLKGDNGSYYLLGTTGGWQRQTFGPVPSQYIGIQYSYSGTADIKLDWHTSTLTFLPVPVGGVLYIFFPAADPLWGEVHYQNLRFDYTPFVNGSYAKYNGQYHSVSQALNTQAKREKQVYMSDAPRPGFKGGIRVYNGASWVPAGLFYNAAVHTGGPPVLAAGGRHPYGHIQVFSVWNQYNRIMRKFEGTVDGLQTDLVDSEDLPDVPDLLHTIILMDLSPNTTDGVTRFKYFMMLHYSQDFNYCEFDCFLHEVFDTSIPKDYSSPKVFKYITAD